VLFVIVFSNKNVSIDQVIAGRETRVWMHNDNLWDEPLKDARESHSPEAQMNY